MTINNDSSPSFDLSQISKGACVSRFAPNPGIRSYRKAASLIVGSGLLFGTGAQANELAQQAGPPVAT